LAAAGDGLGLVSAGERRYGEHSRQCHEQAEYGFTHFLLLITRNPVPLRAVTDSDARNRDLVVRELWLLRGAHQRLASLKRKL